MCVAIPAIGLATAAQTFSVGVALVGTALGVASSMQQQKVQEKAAKSAAEYNAQVAANEAATQQQLAQAEMAKGAQDRERVIRAGMRQMGESRSQLAASGFEMDSGSALSLLGEGAEELQHDANLVQQDTNMAAWQHLAGAVGANNNEAWAKFQGNNASAGRGASLLGAAGSLLGGMGTALGMYNDYAKTNTPTTAETTKVSSPVLATFTQKTPSLSPMKFR